MPIHGVILLTLFAGSLPICFIRPFYGILLWYIVTIGSPQSDIYYWPIATIVPEDYWSPYQLLSGCSFSDGVGSGMYSSPEVLMMFVLWIWFTITSLVSTQNPVFMHHAADTWSHWGIVFQDAPDDAS